jgi:hypothetical protein
LEHEPSIAAFTPTGAGDEVHVPLRVVQNGTGSEVILTLYRQPAMDDERFAADIKLVIGTRARSRRSSNAQRHADLIDPAPTNEWWSWLRRSSRALIKRMSLARS